MTQDEIIIRKGIVHILDAELGCPVYSEQLLELSPETNDFFREHIFRLLSGDDLKKCRFDEEEASKVYQLVRNFREENMIEASREFAGLLYEIMNANVAIPSADFAVVTFQTGARRYLALLKMNYRESFVHMTEKENGTNVNRIICYKSMLPSCSSKLSEAVLIDLEDFGVQIVEKKYEINGKKEYYLSQRYLHCHAGMSSRAKLDIVTRAVEQVNKKHFAQQPEKQMEAKSLMKQEIETSGSLQVERISEKLYGQTPDIKEEFDEKMEKYHMQKAEVAPQNERTVRKLEKQYLKTDTGIEINIPMEQYQDADQVEFVTNPDGTISVWIKNINELTTR